MCTACYSIIYTVWCEPANMKQLKTNSSRWQYNLNFSSTSPFSSFLHSNLPTKNICDNHVGGPIMGNCRAFWRVGRPHDANSLVTGVWGISSTKRIWKIGAKFEIYVFVYFFEETAHPKDCVKTSMNMNFSNKPVLPIFICVCYITHLVPQHN